MANSAAAEAGPSTSAIAGAVVFWVVAVVLGFLTSPVEEVPAWVWVLRIALVVAGVGYAIWLIMRERSRRSSGLGASRDDTAFDLWTIAHTTAGLVMGAWGLPFVLVVIFTVAWEFFEKYVPGFGEKEIFSNRIVDIIVALVGWLVVAVIISAGTDSPNLPLTWLLPASQSILGG